MNLMEILVYAMLLSPAMVVLMDLLAERSRRALTVVHGLSVVGTGVWLVFRVSQASIMIPMVIAGTLGMVYAVNQLRGVAKFCTALPSAAFLMLAVAEAMPGIGIWARYKDYFYLLFSIASFAVPFVLAWHIWRQLPLCYDGLRGGRWRDDGVPLVVRYRFLAGLAVLGIVATVWLTYRYTESREALAYQANASLLAMHTELKELDHTIGRIMSGDNQEGDIYYVHMYLRELQAAVRRLNSIHQSVGLLQDDSQHTMAETVPDGVRKLFYEGRHSEALTVIRAIIWAIESDLRVGGMSQPAYLSAVDSIMRAISEAGLADYFD